MQLLNDVDVAKAAVRYAERGWRVFPAHSVRDGLCSCGKPECASPGKHPWTGTGFKEATTDPEVIRAWWAQWPDARTGVRTGEVSGLAVIDVDGDAGRKSLAKLVEAHGELPSTREARTPHGRHLYFRYPGDGHDIRCTTRLCGLDGIDVRANGGYVIAPPSDGYRWEGEGECAELPSWLLDLLLNPRQPFGSATTAPSVIANPPGWVADALKNLGVGNRNDTFARLTGKLLRSGFNAEETLAILRPHADGVGFPEDELAREIDGIHGRYESSICHSPPGGMDNGQLEVVSLATVGEPLPRVDLVENIIPLGHTSLLYADGGHCKSLISLAMAMCVAEGMPFAGFKTQPTNSFYMDYELDVNEHARRAFKLARGFGLERPPAGLFYAQASSPIGKIVEQVRTIVQERKIGFIIFDSLGLAAGVDPESARDIIPVFGLLRSLGVTILALDHQPKTKAGQTYQTKTAFGSAYKFNLARSVIQAQKTASQEGALKLRLHPTKNNFGNLVGSIGISFTFDGDAIKLERGDVNNDPDFFAEPGSDEKVVRAIADRVFASTQEIAGDIGLKPETVTNILGKLKAAGTVDLLYQEGRVNWYTLRDKAIRPAWEGFIDEDAEFVPCAAS